jgi:Flp pilus assembly protein protease CpaA
MAGKKCCTTIPNWMVLYLMRIFIVATLIKWFKSALFNAIKVDCFTFFID